MDHGPQDAMPVCEPEEETLNYFRVTQTPPECHTDTRGGVTQTPRNNQYEPNNKKHSIQVKSPAKKTTAPDEFPITDAMWLWATKEGMDHDFIIGETEKMLDWHRSKGELKVSWLATWRNWMRNARDWKPKTQQRENFTETNRRAIADAVRRRMAGQVQPDLPDVWKDPRRLPGSSE